MLIMPWDLGFFLFRLKVGVLLGYVGDARAGIGV